MRSQKINASNQANVLIYQISMSDSNFLPGDEFPNVFHLSHSDLDIRRTIYTNKNKTHVANTFFSNKISNPDFEHD